jgi:hypothetical protein
VYPCYTHGTDDTEQTRLSMFVFRVFHRIVTTMTLSHTVATVTLDIIACQCCICYSLGCPADVIAHLCLFLRFQVLTAASVKIAIV